MAQVSITYLTLLVLDAGAWSWCDELLDWFAPYLAKQPYQVILARASLPVKFGKKEWEGWGAIELTRKKAKDNKTFTEVRQ